MQRDKSQRKRSSYNSRRSQRKRSSYNSRRSQRKRSSYSPRRSQRKRSSYNPRRSQRKRSSYNPRRSQRKRSSYNPRRSQRKRSSYSPRRSQRKRSSYSPRWPQRKRSSYSPRLFAQEFAAFQKCRDLIRGLARKHETLVTRRQDDVVFLPLDMCFGHGNCAIVGAIEVGDKLADAIRRIAGNHANIVLPAHIVCPFAGRVFDDACRHRSAKHGVTPFHRAENIGGARAAKRRTETNDATGNRLQTIGEHAQQNHAAETVTGQV